MWSIYFSTLSPIVSLLTVMKEEGVHRTCKTINHVHLSDFAEFHTHFMVQSELSNYFIHKMQRHTFTSVMLSLPMEQMWHSE